MRLKRNDLSELRTEWTIDCQYDFSGFAELVRRQKLAGC